MTIPIILENQIKMNQIFKKNQNPMKESIV